MQNFRSTQHKLESGSKSNKTYQQPLRFDEFFKPALDTPTVRDISPLNKNSDLVKEFYELSDDHRNDSLAFSPEKNNNLINFYKK